jgi:hypothetical protein
MLEIVEQEQRARAGEGSGESGDGALLRPLGDAQGGGDGGGDEGRVGEGGEVDEDDAVREPRRRPRRGLDGEARLAGAADPGQGDEADLGLGQQPMECGQLLCAADERRRGDRQRGEGGHGRDRGAAAGGLEEALPRRAAQRQTGGQQARRLPPRGAVDAALQIAEAAHAQTGALGQFLLGQARVIAQAAQQRAEGFAPVLAQRRLHPLDRFAFTWVVTWVLRVVTATSSAHTGRSEAYPLQR